MSHGPYYEQRTDVVVLITDTFVHCGKLSFGKFWKSNKYNKRFSEVGWLDFVAKDYYHNGYTTYIDRLDNLTSVEFDIKNLIVFYRNVPVQTTCPLPIKNIVKNMASGKVSVNVNKGQN